MKPLLLPIIALLATHLSAQTETTIAVGDKAPPLALGKFLQGDPVTEFEKGKTYVVEFWATWCGPCVETIPHINDLQKKLADKDLIVIGSNIMEQNDAGIPDFIKTMGDKMTYRVATDDKSDGGPGKMLKTWFEASNQQGIPVAFVINKDGLIAWIGHPANLDESILTSIIDDTFDHISHAKNTVEEESKMSLLNSQLRKIELLAAKSKHDEVIAAAKKLQEIDPEAMEVRRASHFIAMSAHYTKNDNKSLEKEALSAIETSKTISKPDENAALLNEIAWALTTAFSQMKDLDHSVAQTLALEAATITKQENPAILDTLARAQFLSGDKDAAIATAKKALTLLPFESPEIDSVALQTQLESNFASYEAGQLPVIPQPGTEPTPEAVATEEAIMKAVAQEEANTEEAKTEEAKTEEANTEEAKTEEAKTEEAKTEEAKTEEAKTEEELIKAAIIDASGN